MNCKIWQSPHKIEKEIENDYLAEQLLVVASDS